MVSSASLRLYHWLPPAGRSVAASVRGLRLKAWRYGPDAERLVAEARDRETWTEAQWRDWTAERLAFVLRRAAARVPYYRRQWEERRRRGDRSSVESLENWPILEKESLREAPGSFVADDCDVRRMYHEHTSGTTGTPLDLWLSRRTLRAWYALYEARTRLWHGVGAGERWAMLGGQLVAPVSQTRPPFWVFNFPMRQLYLSSYHLSPDTVASYLEAMRRHRVTHLVGYPSSMAALAQMALDQGLRPAPLRVAFSNAEPLSPSQRERIGTAFGCPVRDTYGMSEIVCGASECGSGAMHLWPEAGLVEILEEASDAPAPSGESGRLIGTSLLNADMPLVRYAVGDRAASAPPGEPCACGRRLPQLRRIEGRSDDVVVTPEGRLVGRLDPVFKADLPIREAQIVQESLRRVRVKIVPAGELDTDAVRTVQDRIQQRLGSAMEVLVEIVSEIPRGPNGKFRAVVSLLPREPGRSSPAAADPKTEAGTEGRAQR